MAKSKYSSFQDKYILDNYGAISASKIGEILGISKCCVIGRHWRLIQKKKNTEITTKSFKDYLDEINGSYI